MLVFDEVEYLKEIEGKEESKKYAINLIYDFWYDDLNFCGCGTPWDTLDIIKQLLNMIYRRFDNENKYDYVNFKSEVCNIFECKSRYMSMQIYEIIANVLDVAGLLEHGSCITGSWLTDYGEEVRKALNGVDRFELENFSRIKEMFDIINEHGVEFYTKKDELKASKESSEAIEIMKKKILKSLEEMYNEGKNN